MRTLWPTTTPFDRLIVAGLVVAGEVEVWLTQSYDGPRGLTATMAVARGLALLWRRSHPVAVLAFEVAAMAPVLLHDVPPIREDSVSEVLPGLVALYSAGAYATGRALVAGGLIVVAAALLRSYEDAGEVFGSLGFFGGIFGGTWVAGVVVGRLRARTRNAEDRAGRAEAERERRAREAVAEERTRIGRELHDVVAHAISVIVLQAKGGR